MNESNGYVLLINKYFKNNQKSFNFVAEYYGKKINKRIKIYLSNKEKTSCCYFNSHNMVEVIISTKNILSIVEDMGEHAELIEQFLYTFIMHEIGHALWDFSSYYSEYFCKVFQLPMFSSLLNTVCDNRLERIIEEDNAKVKFKLARYVIFDKRLSEVFSIWKTEVLKGQNFDFTNALFRMIKNKPVVDFMKSIDERIELPLLRLIDCEKRFRATNGVLFDDDTNKSLIQLFEEMVGYAKEINQIIGEKKAEEKSEKAEDKNDNNGESNDNNDETNDNNGESNDNNDETNDNNDDGHGFESDLDLESDLYSLKKITQKIGGEEDNCQKEVSEIFISEVDKTEYKKYKIGIVTSNRIRGIQGALKREEQQKKRSGNQKELSLKSYARREYAAGEKMFEIKNEVIKNGNNNAKVTFIIDVSGSMSYDFFDGYETKRRYQFVIDYVKSFYDQTSRFLDIQIYTFSSSYSRELTLNGENFIVNGINELNRNALRENIFSEIVGGGTRLPLIRPIEKNEETIIITDGSFSNIDSEYLNKATFVFIDFNGEGTDESTQETFSPVKKKIFVNYGDNIVKSFEKATEKIKDILSKKVR